MIWHRAKKIVLEVGGVPKRRKQLFAIIAEQKIILFIDGKLNREIIPLHCSGFLAQFEDDILNKRVVPEDVYLSSISSSLDEWESDEV